MSNRKRDIKNIQHADDVAFALYDIPSFNIAVKTVETFWKQASSKVNLSKTECILLGGLEYKFTSVGVLNTT